MKETVKMSRAVGQLEKMYNSLNADFFGGALPVPIITVQSKPGTWGHCSRAQIWRRKEGTAYEMNIAAEAVGQELEEILDTLLHILPLDSVQSSTDNRNIAKPRIKLCIPIVSGRSIHHNIFCRGLRTKASSGNRDHNDKT